MGESARLVRNYTKGADANPTEASPVPEQQNEIIEVKEAVQIDLELE